MAETRATNWSVPRKTPGFVVPLGTKVIAGGSLQPNLNALTCATFVRSEKLNKKGKNPKNYEKNKLSLLPFKILYELSIVIVPNLCRKLLLHIKKRL